MQNHEVSVSENLQYWVDSSKRRNDAKNLMLLNKSFNFIK